MNLDEFLGKPQWLDVTKVYCSRDSECMAWVVGTEAVTGPWMQEHYHLTGHHEFHFADADETVPYRVYTRGDAPPAYVFAADHTEETP